jgi:hypothetical protein
MKASLLLSVLFLLIACGQRDYIRTVTPQAIKSLKKSLEGCTFAKASNYDPEAQEDDGSCQFWGCSDRNFQNFDAQLDSYIQSYIKEMEGKGIVVRYEDAYQAQCGNKIGCRSELAENYDPNAEVAGSCFFKACLNASYENFIGAEKKDLIESYLANVEGSTHEKTCSGKLGCMNPFAKNYKDIYQVEDGSCEFDGCYLANYDNTAEQDVIDSINLYLEKYPEAMITNNCAGLQGCTNQYANNITPGATSDNGTCSFVRCLLPDYENSEEADIIKNIQDYLANNENATHTSNCAGLKGCTEPNADNYKKESQSEDGSCIHKACLDKKYSNYIGDDKAFAINIYLAKYGKGNFSNTCTGILGCKLAHANNYDPSVEVADKNSCIIEQCLNETYVNYIGKDKHKEIQDYIDLYGYESLKDTCTGKMGCTLTQAVNPTEGATVDDGSCEFKACLDEDSDDVEKDEDLKLINDYLALYGQDRLIENTCQNYSGCMFKLDPYVSNVDPKANIEDGSCKISACTDSGFDEYAGDLDAGAINTYLETYGRIHYTNTCKNSLGCKLDFAVNYDKDADKESGLCVVNICDDPNYLEYNETNYKLLETYRLNYPNAVINTVGQCNNPRLIEMSQSINIQTEQIVQSIGTDINIVVDNSPSMLPSQLKLKKALKNIADILDQAKDVNIRFYAMSDIIKERIIYRSGRINETEAGYTQEYTKVWDLQEPVSTVAINEQMTEFEIRNAISQAINLIETDADFTDEEGLCPLMRLIDDQVGGDPNNGQRSLVNFILTNENDQSGHLASQCQFEWKYQIHRNFIVRESRLKVVHKEWQFKVQHLDPNSELYERYYYHPSTEAIGILNNDAWLTLENQGFQACPDAIKELVESRLSNGKAVHTCEYRAFDRKRYIDIPQGSALETELAIGGDLCSLSSYTIDESVYSNLNDYFNQRYSYTGDYSLTDIAMKSCETQPGYNSATYAGRDTVYDHNIESVYGMNHIVHSLAPIFTSKGLTEAEQKQIKSIIFFYDQNNQADCSADELAVMGHGSRYIEFIENQIEAGFYAYAGNICSDSYDSEVEASLGKIVEQASQLRYQLSNWDTNAVIGDSIKVKLVNDSNNLETSVITSQYSIAQESEDYYISFPGSMNETLAQFDRIVIEYTMNNTSMNE